MTITTPTVRRAEATGVHAGSSKRAAVRLGRDDRIRVAAVAAVAIAMRLVLLLSYRPLRSPDTPDYFDLAHRLASLNFSGWQARRTPGFPLLLLAVHYSPTAAWWMQASLGVIATLMVYALIRLLRGTPNAALLGALAYGASLEVIAVERTLLTEALTTFLLLAAAVACVVMIRRARTGTRPRGAYALVALLLLALCMTRPDALVAALCLALATAALLVAGARPAATRARRAAHFAAITAILIGPAAAGMLAWSIVNADTAGVFTVSSVAGFNMIDHVGAYVRPRPGPDAAITSAYAAAYRRSHGSGLPSYFAVPEIRRRTGLDAAQIGARYLRVGLGLAVAHPIGFVTSSLRQWVYAWRQPNYADSFSGGSAGSVTSPLWSVERALQIAISVVFLALCALAAVLLARGRRGVHATTAVVASTALVGTLMSGFIGYTDTARYAYPYLPLVIVVVFAATAGVARSAPIGAVIAGRGKMPSRASTPGGGRT